MNDLWFGVFGFGFLGLTQFSLRIIGLLSGSGNLSRWKLVPQVEGCLRFGFEDKLELNLGTWDVVLLVIVHVALNPKP